MECTCVIHVQEWFTVYDQYRRTNCIVSDLIMGNEYVFRAFSNNLVGQSQEACNTKDGAYIQKTGGQWPHMYCNITQIQHHLYKDCDLMSRECAWLWIWVCLFRYRVQAAHPQGSRLLRGSQVHTSFGEPLYYSRIQRHPQLLCQRHTKGKWEKHYHDCLLNAALIITNDKYFPCYVHCWAFPRFVLFCHSLHTVTLSPALLAQSDLVQK